jgi:hypothetical protein
MEAPTSILPAMISRTVPRCFVTPLYANAVFLSVVVDINPNSTARHRVCSAEIQLSYYFYNCNIIVSLSRLLLLLSLHTSSQVRKYTFTRILPAPYLVEDEQQQQLPKIQRGSMQKTIVVMI